MKKPLPPSYQIPTTSLAVVVTNSKGAGLRLGGRRLPGAVRSFGRDNGWRRIARSHRRRGRGGYVSDDAPRERGSVDDSKVEEVEFEIGEGSVKERE